MTSQITEEKNQLPVDAPKQKAPCLETVFKRMQECNGAIRALYRDLDYVTRTAPPNEVSIEADSENPKIPSPNLANLQNEIDIVRDQIRRCRKKIEKLRWG